MQIEWTKSLWTRGNHNAFTDLCEFRDSLFCCFREAQNHISQDGKIRVLTCNRTGRIRGNSVLGIPGADLRDPKLSIDPDGNLLLLAFARYTRADNTTRFGQPVCWVSQDGRSWSGVHHFGERYWWLWRVRWQDNTAYGFGYNRRQQTLHLYHGNPRRTFERLKSNAFSYARQGLGYPNETDLVFASDRTMYCLLRRDADSFSAQLGTSKPPYTQWKWKDLGEYIGGPVMMLLSDNYALVAGRRWHNRRMKTAIWTLDLQRGILAYEYELPSGGDNSYPGLVKSEGGFFVSHYSSHIDGKSSIFLSRVTL